MGVPPMGLDLHQSCFCSQGERMQPKGPVKKRHGANLPHWTADGAIYAVTFRLADSLPQSIIQECKRKRAVLLAAYHEPHGRDAHATP